MSDVHTLVNVGRSYRSKLLIYAVVRRKFADTPVCEQESDLIAAIGRHARDAQAREQIPDSLCFVADGLRALDRHRFWRALQEIQINAGKERDVKSGLMKNGWRCRERNQRCR